MRRKRCIRKERVEENAESDRWLSVTRKQTWCEADSASCSENGSSGHGRVYLTRMRCHYADLLLRGPFFPQKRIQRCVECEYTEFMLTNYFGNTPLVHWRLLVVLLRVLYWIENIEEINPADLLFVLTVQLLKYLSTTQGLWTGVQPSAAVRLFWNFSNKR